MWLATKHGFFSIANPGDGVFAIRSHLRGDLENLLGEIGQGEIRDASESSDFPWELLTDRSAFLQLFAELLDQTGSEDLAKAVRKIPDQATKEPVYQSLRTGLLKLQMEELGAEFAADESVRAIWEEVIRQEIKTIAKQSSLDGVDDHEWDVTRISWTGEEWIGFRPYPGHCYVEAFEHANPPHDFIYVVSVLTGRPEFMASFEGDLDTFELTVWRQDAEVLDLPDSVPRP